MDEEEQYEKVCRPALETIHIKVDKILLILQGNGKIGLVTKVELQGQDISALKGFRKWLMGIMTSLCIALILVIIKVVFL